MTGAQTACASFFTGSRVGVRTDHIEGSSYFSCGDDCLCLVQGLHKVLLPGLLVDVDPVVIVSQVPSELLQGINLQTVSEDKTSQRRIREFGQPRTSMVGVGVISQTPSRRCFGSYFSKKKPVCISLWLGMQDLYPDSNKRCAKKHTETFALPFCRNGFSCLPLLIGAFWSANSCKLMKWRRLLQQPMHVTWMFWSRLAALH